MDRRGWVDVKCLERAFRGGHDRPGKSRGRPF